MHILPIANIYNEHINVMTYVATLWGDYLKKTKIQFLYDTCRVLELSLEYNNCSGDLATLCNQ